MPSHLHSPSLTALIHRHAVEGPERLAVVDGSTHEQLTYRQLIAQTRQVATLLDDAGVRAGDRVGILSANSLPYVVLLLALAERGAIAVPQNTRLHPGEITDNLRDARATTLVSSAELSSVATAVADELGISRRYLLEGEADGWEPLLRTG